MTELKLERDIIEKRLNGIQGELKELADLARQDFAEFDQGVGFKLAQYHLHRALEGVFNITAHILSRIPGAEVTKYKDMALKLGEMDIVEKGYAQEILYKMAGYRNRLVHFYYAEITAQEVYQILQQHLPDLEVFMSAIKKLLEDPKKFNLEIE